MKLKTILKLPLAILALSASINATHASNIDVLSSQDFEMQKTVVGVWSTNDRISFSKSGTYSILLSDFGLSPNNFGDSFNYLGAMISSSTHNKASVELNQNSSAGHSFFTFDITAGEYWLSMFAITDSRSNAGTFNFRILEGATNPVPLPAAFWLMLTSVLGLISFARQRRANKSV